MSGQPRLAQQLLEKDEGGTELADEDYFSKLPRDCLLNVFSRVDRETLDEMECVSKNISNVVNDNSLKRIKIHGELLIYEQRSGHLFTMNNNEKCYSLSYHIDRITNVGVRSRLDKLYDEQYSDWPPYEWDPKDDKFGLHKDDVVNYGASGTIPAKLFDNLSQVLEKFSYSKTVFQWIKVDQYFFDQISHLNSAQKAGGRKEFRFWEVLFEESFDPKVFADFILASKLTHFYNLNSHQDIPHYTRFLRTFDEQFLTQFAENVPPTIAPRFSMMVFCNWTTPAFAMDNMKMEPTVFVELIMMRFHLDRMPRFEGENWQFTLTHFPEEDDFEQLREINEFSVSYEDDQSVHDGTDFYTVKKEGALFYCRYGIMTRDNGDELVQVIFSPNEEKVEEVQNNEEENQD